MDAPKSSAPGQGPVLAWRGDDPITFSRVLAALRDAGIPSHEITENNQLTLQLASRRGYGIFVRNEDAPRALEIVREIVEAALSE
ncbi:MAG: hypothetical protein ABSE45_17390 [Candidatus Acidiferrales bacterium]|jgi:hypothetical protein